MKDVLQKLLYRLSGRFQGFLFVSAILLILILLAYTREIVEDLRQEARGILTIYAQMYARAASDESVSDLSFIFDQIIKQTNFPLIYADRERKPIYWKGIDVDPMDRSPEAVKRVTKIMRRMGRIADPIPITYKDIILGYLFYGDSVTITRLRWLPYIEIGVVGLFIFIGFLGFSSIKRSEQRFIWVGMAKETAHQLGTPLSSLIGWLEILKESQKHPERFQKTLEEMEGDVQRLRKVASRFSQIGSQTDLREQNVNEVIRNVVRYFQRRLPQMGREIQIQENYEEVPSVRLNSELFEWVMENLIKNALDAMDKEKGLIEIHTGRLNHRKSPRVFIDVKDNGRGIDSKIRRHIFRPGFSTKRRGWGLGLSLSKRIIEEYHRGRLFIKETRPGQGTTMRIVLR